MQMMLSEYYSAHKDEYISKTPVELFKKTVEWYPGKIAVIDGDVEITYEQLDNLSDRLAHYLKEHDGVVPGDVVCIYTGRSYMTVISRLAIWKAGAAYMAVDDGGLRFMERMSAGIGQVKAVIDADYYAAAIEAVPAEIKVEDLSKADAVAMVLFTSGSTGHPKGVRILHSNIVTSASNYDKLYMQSSDRYATLASPMFIASLYDFMVSMSIGCTLVIIPMVICRDIRELAKYYISVGVSLTFLPPHMAIKYLSVDENSPLRVLLVGSEVTRNLEKRPYKIVNVYASSEACAVITHYDVCDAQERYPIGELVPTLKAYVVNDEGKLAQPGERGELWLAGPQIFDKYVGVGADEENAAHFTENTFEECEAPFNRLFKTSDIVMRDNDGNFHYLCRKDHMYKVRGFRVEINGIEVHMQTFPGIIDVAATCFTDKGGTNIIFGFYTSEQEIDHTALRQHLLSKLPEYSVPTCLIRLDSMPRTLSGKADRNQLVPPPELNDHKKLAVLYY